MIPGDLNLYIKQGADYQLDLTILQGEPIRVSAAVVAGSSSIPVTPLREAIAADRYVLFGKDLRLQIAIDADLGAELLTLSATTPLPISKNTSAQVCADLTDCTARAQFKGKLTTDETPDTFAIAFASDRLTGDLSLSLTNIETSLIAANLELGDRITDDELQARERQDNDYDWDLEIEYPSGIVESPMKGLIVCYPEVTLIDS
jgi:hypothetical protein